MSLVDRGYGDIVADVLTTLTQGVVGETHRVDYDPLARPLLVPEIILYRRPVRRVSTVRGLVAGTKSDDPPVATTFALNEYDLVAGSDDPASPDRIRFRPLSRRKPAPGTDLLVSYYPRTTDPTPLTDLNVGSVARTLLEAVSRELAALYAQLNIAFDGAFVETAEGTSLERVVALLGFARMRAGRPVGEVTFSRRAGQGGEITIPAGVPVTDTTDTLRYLTSERYVMLAGQGFAQVRIHGELPTTPVVKAGQLSVIQRAIAGLDAVTNERATARAVEDEGDEGLRVRARDALLAANKGTVEAMRYGLLALHQVKDVSIVEMPNGVPGEIEVKVQLAEGAGSGDELPSEVIERIEALRPAGIRVIGGRAVSAALAANVGLTLTGAGAPDAEIAAIREAAAARLIAEIGRKGVGERVRLKPLLATLLGDSRIADATLELGPVGGGASESDFQPNSAASALLARADVTFSPVEFTDALAGSDQTVMVTVTAAIAASATAGAAPDAIRAELKARLETFLAALKAGGLIDAPALIAALRNDAAYAIDPLKSAVTLQAGDQFVTIAQGGQAFAVGPQHRFEVTAVELAK